MHKVRFQSFCPCESAQPVEDISCGIVSFINTFLPKNVRISQFSFTWIFPERMKPWDIFTACHYTKKEKKKKVVTNYNNFWPRTQAYNNIFSFNLF